MRRHWSIGLFAAAVAVILTGCSITGRPQAPLTDSAVLKDFVSRTAGARGQLEHIIAAAEAAAQRKLDHPEALINVPYGSQSSFAEEILNRSGGLAGALPSVERPTLTSDYDIVIFSIRSWETEGPAGIEYLKECREKGWMTIFFASAAGKPDDLDVDFFIDNGAPDGSEAHEAVNVIANCLNGWLWVCEYTAALTRQGRHPGILQSITTPGWKKHDHPIQARNTRHNNYPCDFPVPRKDLAYVYLTRVDRLIDDLSGGHTQSQIAKAADVIAARIRSEANVYVSTNTHIMLNELDKNKKTPWKPLMAVHNPAKVFGEALGEGDLLFWLGFNGVSVWFYDDGPTALWNDYDTAIRATGADFITCFATDPLHADNNGHGALAHIEQKWNFGDAVVPIPFPPGRMAPISGLYQAMIYRMLDEAVASRLK